MRLICFEDSLHPKIETRPGGRVIYDESKVIVLSQMLNNCYVKDINVKFLDGVKNVQNFISELNTSSDIYLIYIDTPADNKFVLDLLIDILNDIIVRNLYNVILIPIPCIEYHAIKCFAQVNEEVTIALDRLKYKNTDTYKYNMSKKFCSFEKYCKAVFSKYVPERFRGAVDANNFSIDKKTCLHLLNSLPIIFKTDGNHSGQNPVPRLQWAFYELLKQIDLYACYNNLDAEYLKYLFSEYCNILNQHKIWLNLKED